MLARRLPLALVLISVLALPALAAPADAQSPAMVRKPIALREAARQGLVSVRGVRPQSYRGVTLELENRSGQPIELDLCGSFLRPIRGGSCQRLGLGPLVKPDRRRGTPPGSIVVSLVPDEKRDVAVRTVCLDAGRSAPRNQVFGISDRPLPPVRETVMRWWADHPTAPQGAVNAAIWQNRDTVHVTPGVVQDYRRSKGRFVAAHGGTVYTLNDGVLMSTDGDGVRRFLGTEIFQVMPTARGVYAIGLGADRRPELWIHSMTGDQPWQKVMDVDAGMRILDLWPAGAGSLLLVTDAGLRFHAPGDDHSRLALATSQILDLSIRRVGAHRLLATVKEPGSPGLYRGGGVEGQQQDAFCLWTIDARTGAASRLKRYWTVSSMLAGEAGTFGLSHRGALRRLVGKSFRTLRTSGRYDRIVAVGRKTIWLRDAGGELVAAAAKSGAPRFRTGLTPEGEVAFRLDPVTDDLVFVGGAAFCRVRAADGVAESIR